MAEVNSTAAAKADAKALARLTSSVAGLAVALVANGFKLEEGADPVEAAIVAIKGQAATIDELEKNASEAAIAAVDRADKAEAALGEATKKLEELRNDVKDLEERIDVLQAGAVPASTDPVDEAEAAPERPANARDFGPTFGNLEATELATILEDDPELELAFSNGLFESVGLLPLPVKAADLRSRGGRYHLVPAIHITAGDVEEKIAGASLVRDGEQLAYCEFPRPIVMEPKATQRFERAIAFG